MDSGRAGAGLVMDDEGGRVKRNLIAFLFLFAGAASVSAGPIRGLVDLATGVAVPDADVRYVTSTNEVYTNALSQSADAFGWGNHSTNGYAYTNVIATQVWSQAQYPLALTNAAAFDPAGSATALSNSLGSAAFTDSTNYVTVLAGAGYAVKGAYNEFTATNRFSSDLEVGAVDLNTMILANTVYAGPYISTNLSNGRPFYTKSFGQIISWDGSKWILYANLQVRARGQNDVATPDKVTLWYSGSIGSTPIALDLNPDYDLAMAVSGGVSYAYHTATNGNEIVNYQTLTNKLSLINTLNSGISLGVLPSPEASSAYGAALYAADNSAVLVVGAPDWTGGATQQGTVYVYDKASLMWDSWTQRGASLTASDFGDYAFFGCSVDLTTDGNILVVGAKGRPGSELLRRGGVYVYDRNGSVWTERSIIEQAVSGDYEWFGTSVSISTNGTVLAAGAPGRDNPPNNDSGAVYIYDWTGAAWVYRGLIIDIDPNFGIEFGSAVSLTPDGLSIFVGAPLKGITAIGQGVVRQYDWNGSAWVYVTTLVAPDAGVNYNLGRSLDAKADGYTLMIGAKGASGVPVGKGAVYVFKKVNGVWTYNNTLTAEDGLGTDEFGTAIAIANDTQDLFVGAPGKSSSSGAVYAYDGGLEGNCYVIGNLLPSEQELFSLGSPDSRWQTLYVKDSSIYLGTNKLSITNGQIAVTGGTNAPVLYATEPWVQAELLTITNNLTSYVSTNNPAYTNALSQSADAFGWGNHSTNGYAVVNSNNVFTGTNIFDVIQTSTNGDINGTVKLWDGSMQAGYGLASTDIGYGCVGILQLGVRFITNSTVSHVGPGAGNIQQATVNGSSAVIITGNVYSSSQKIYSTQTSRAVMSGATPPVTGSMQAGRLYGGATMTNENSAGCIQLGHLTTNQHSLVRNSIGSIGLGAVTITNATNVIVVGNGQVAHGDGSVTAGGGFWTTNSHASNDWVVNYQTMTNYVALNSAGTNSALLNANNVFTGTTNTFNGQLVTTNLVVRSDSSFGSGNLIVGMNNTVTGYVRGSTVLGIGASSSGSYTFTWNSENVPYNNQSEGSFSINPRLGIRNVFVGTNTLAYALVGAGTNASDLVNYQTLTNHTTSISTNYAYRSVVATQVWSVAQYPLAVTGTPWVASVQSNSDAIAVLETGKVSVVDWANSNLVYQGHYDLLSTGKLDVAVSTNYAKLNSNNVFKGTINTFGGDIDVGTNAVRGSRFGNFAGDASSGSGWSAVGEGAGFGATHTNSHSFGRWAGNAARGDNRMYLDVYSSPNGPAYGADGATNDTIFMDSDGKLYLGGGPARAEIASAGGVLRGPWGFDSHFIPTASNVYDVGSSNFPVRDVYVGANSIYLGSVKLSVSNDMLVVASGTNVSSEAVVKNDPIYTNALAQASGSVQTNDSAYLNLLTNMATAAQGSNADTAYGWGDHATNGYLTVEADPVFTNWLATTPPVYTESDPVFTNWLETTPPVYTEVDPVFTSSVAASITSVNTSNWSTAYGWGNHSTNEYAYTNVVATQVWSVAQYPLALTNAAAFDIAGTSTELSNSLGTAAFTAATNYATAEQGALADTALQAETDTLQTITDRGATTTNTITAGAYYVGSTNIGAYATTAYGWGNHATNGYALTSDNSVTWPAAVNVAGPTWTIDYTNLMQRVNFTGTITNMVFQTLTNAQTRLVEVWISNAKSNTYSPDGLWVREPSWTNQNVHAVISWSLGGVSASMDKERP